MRSGYVWDDARSSMKYGYNCRYRAVPLPVLDEIHC